MVLFWHIWQILNTHNSGQKSIRGAAQKLPDGDSLPLVEILWHIVLSGQIRATHVDIPLRCSV
jgi:hypothetical protein